MKNITEKLFYILVPALFTFPLFKESISTFLFILLASNTLFFTLASKNYKIRNREILYFTIPFWIILVTSLFYIHSIHNFRPIKNALYFLLFPLVFYYIPTVHFTKEKIRFYLNILKNVCLIVAIGYLIAFFWYYDFADLFLLKYEIPKFRVFVYEEISFFKIHPTYYTSMLVLCSAYAFDKVLKQKKYHELLYVILFVFISFMLLTRLNLVFLLLTLCFMVLFRSGFSKTQKMLVIASSIIASIIMVFSIPGIKYRFNELVNSYNRPPAGMAYDSTNIRAAIYNCCWEIAKTDYLLGVGFTNLGKELQNCYEENYDSEFYKQQGYLSHNYFYYIFLSSGIFGLLMYLFYVYKVAVAAWRIKHFLLYVCLINVFIMCLSEDFFYRQFGLFFYCLIFFTFYFSKKASEKTDVAS